MRSDAVVLERAKGPSREGPFALSALLFSYREPAEDQRRREKPSDAGAIVHTKGESTLEVLCLSSAIWNLRSQMMIRISYLMHLWRL